MSKVSRHMATLAVGLLFTATFDIRGRAAREVRSRDATPDYDLVFDQSRVGRLDLTMTQASYQVMVDDMNSMTARGTGPGGAPPGGGPPGGGQPGNQAAIAACNGLVEGSTCSFGNPPINGRCARVAADTPLMCTPLGAGNPPGGGNPGGGGAGGNRDDVELLPRTPVYVPVKVTFDGESFEQVGFRLKGNSSLVTSWRSGTEKLPFRLNFDALEESYPAIRDQTFFGFTDLAFSNGALDSSYLRQKIALDLFREAGLPAPRTAFMRVYLDRGAGATYLGLYTMTEVPSGPMLRAHFGSDDGNLYKPSGTGGRWTTFIADDFPKRTNEADEDWTDVEDAIAALTASRVDAARWRQRLEARFDVSTFLRWLALNTIVDNFDAYGGLSAHNYYLYGSPRHRDRLFWIPWDYDLSLSTGGGGPGGGVGGGRGLDLFHSASRADQWPLIRLLLDDPVYRAAYRGHLQELLNTVFEPGRLAAAFRSEQARIAPYVIGAEGERANSSFAGTPAQFDATVHGTNGLAAYVQNRASTLRVALAGAQ